MEPHEHASLIKSATLEKLAWLTDPELSGNESVIEVHHNYRGVGLIFVLTRYRVGIGEEFGSINLGVRRRSGGEGVDATYGTLVAGYPELGLTGDDQRVDTPAQIQEALANIDKALRHIRPVLAGDVLARQAFEARFNLWPSEKRERGASG